MLAVSQAGLRVGWHAGEEDFLPPVCSEHVLRPRGASFLNPRMGATVPGLPHPGSSPYFSMQSDPGTQGHSVRSDPGMQGCSVWSDPVMQGCSVRSDPVRWSLNMPCWFAPGGFTCVLPLFLFSSLPSGFCINVTSSERPHLTPLKISSHTEV